MLKKEKKIVKVTKSYVYTKKDRPNYLVVLEYSDVEGKRKYITEATNISVAGNNKRKAEQKLKEVVKEYEDRYNAYLKEQEHLAEEANSASGSNIPFLDFYAGWLDSIKETVRASTWDGYYLVYKAHIIPYFKELNLKISEVTQYHLQKYVDYKKEAISANTAIKHFINLNQCFKKAFRDGLIQQNPMIFVIKPKLIEFRGAKIYEVDEMQLLLSCLKNEVMDTLIKITLFYGFRRSEVLGLKWKAIDFNRRTITVEHTITQTNTNIHMEDNVKRGGSFRTLPLMDSIYEELLEIKAKQEENKKNYEDYKDTDYIFTNVNGTTIQPQMVSHYFRRFLKNNNLKPVSFHDLRHSTASFLHAKGYDLKEIQEWLGHGSVATTLKYLHITTEQKQKMGEELDNIFLNIKKVSESL